MHDAVATVNYIRTLFNNAAGSGDEYAASHALQHARRSPKKCALW